MLFYIITFIVFFLFVFFISFYFLRYKNLVKDNLYVIIPAICIGLWAIYVLINNNLIKSDFNAFYYSGRQVFLDPSKLYKDSAYLYMPNFALLFSVTLSLLPYSIAYYIFFVINYILGVLTIREFNKILILMNINKKIHRFIFLLIISNGYFIYRQFLTNQTKYIILVILLFIIRRELQFNELQKEKDLKYYLINFNLFIFAIGMAPNFSFLLLIYIFQDIPRNKLFEKENFKKYGMVILIFIIQNILFVIFPNLIFDFLDIFNRPFDYDDRIEILYLREWIELSGKVVRYILLIFTIILFSISLFLTFNNNLRVEEKFSLFALTYLFIGVYGSSRKLPIILLPLILILFVPYLKQNTKGLKFIKSNSLLIIGLFSITLISFLLRNNIIYNIYPSLQEEPFVVLDNLRYIIVLSIMLISLSLLKLKEYKLRNIDIE